MRPRAATDELARVHTDQAGFLAGMDDLGAASVPVTPPDGSTVKRKPGFRRWMWDGECCGSIGPRWQIGTTDLPPHGLGHLGYALVPWEQGRGFARAALAHSLPEARFIGLPFVQLTTDPDNVASQLVIAANGGSSLSGSPSHRHLATGLGGGFASPSRPLPNSSLETPPLLRRGPSGRWSAAGHL